MADQTDGNRCRPDLVVIPCGGKKTSHRAMAMNLYTGSYFLRAATALHPTRGWLILSAKHGLVTPETMLDPYDLLMGRPGSVTVERIRRQAEVLGVAGLAHVVVLAGAAYTAKARQVWPHAATPLSGLPGMGHQMRYLARVSRTGAL